MLEKERKFKLNFLPENLKPQSIKQGYIFIKYKNELRVRIIDNEKAFLTYKINHTHKPGVRSEYEYEIPLEDGRELMDSAKYSLQKVRYKTEFNGCKVDIDIYPNGMGVVEIEYEEEFTEIPDYCGEEITGDTYYDNANIAHRGACK